MECTLIKAQKLISSISILTSSISTNMLTRGTLLLDATNKWLIIYDHFQRGYFTDYSSPSRQPEFCFPRSRKIKQHSEWVWFYVDRTWQLSSLDSLDFISTAFTTWNEMFELKECYHAKIQEFLEQYPLPETLLTASQEILREVGKIYLP